MKQIQKSQSIRNMHSHKPLQRQTTSTHLDHDEFDAFNWEDLRHLFQIRERNFERYNKIIDVAERNLRSDHLRQKYLESILSKIPPHKRSSSEVRLLEKLTQRWSIINTLLKSGSKNTDIHGYACSVFKLRYYDKGQTIIVEGDKPDGFFYILEGLVNIYKKIEPRGSDLNNRPLLAKQILRLKKKRALLKLKFITILKTYKKQSQESCSPIMQRRRTSVYNRQIQLKQANDQNDIQNLCGGLQLQEIHNLSLFFGAGCHLQQQFVVTLGSDKYFGELGILTGNPRARSVVAKVPCKLIYLSVKDYSMIFKQQEQRKLRRKITFFQQNFFHGIDPQLILKLHYNFIKSKYTINQTIYKRGDPVDQIYVIKSGTVELLGESGQRLAQIIDGNLFGESEIMLKKRSRLVTAICKSDRLTLYTLTKAWFQKLMQENLIFRKIVNSKSSKRIHWQETLQDKYISIVNSDSLNTSFPDNQTQVTSNQFRDYVHMNYRSAEQSPIGSKTNLDQTNVDLHKINRDLNMINKYSVQIRKINHRKESSLDLSKSRSKLVNNSKEALKGKRNIKIKMVSSQFSIHQSVRKNHLTQLYEVINKSDSMKQLKFDFLGWRPKMSVLQNIKK